MRSLESEEIVRMEPFIESAVQQARLSPCQKSKRGAVVFKDGTILGVGNNAPPDPLICNPEVCQSICAKYAVHAEQNALYQVLERRMIVQGASIFHIKVDQDGSIVPSDDLSCVECSRLILRLGLNEFILYQRNGFMAYPALEFHQLTLDYLKGT